MADLFGWICSITDRSWKPKTEMDFAALHESGHAVVAATSGCAVKRVIVTQQGVARIGLTDYDLPALQFQKCLAMEIGILYGGKAAESILGGRQSSRGILQDERDIGNLVNQLQTVGSLPLTIAELLSHCETGAREIIQLNKGVVRKLAALLSKTGGVESEQLRKILSSVRAPKAS
jgi:ATP-dependent Zn protease